MDRSQMLNALSAQGETYGGIGWVVEDGSTPVLAVTHRPDEGDPVTLRWALTPVGLPPVAPVAVAQPATEDPTEGNW